MQLCGVRSGNADLWRRTGTDYANHCTLDAQRLLWRAQGQRGGPLFYDIYYVDRLDAASAGGGVELGGGEEGAPVLYPVPVIVENVAANALAATRLTRRVFVLDAALGAAAGGGGVAWVQYPQSIRLEIEVRHCQCELLSPRATRRRCASLEHHVPVLRVLGRRAIAQIGV